MFQPAAILLFSSSAHECYFPPPPIPPEPINSWYATPRDDKSPFFSLFLISAKYTGGDERHKQIRKYIWKTKCCLFFFGKADLGGRYIVVEDFVASLPFFFLSFFNSCFNKLSCDYHWFFPSVSSSFFLLFFSYTSRFKILLFFFFTISLSNFLYFRYFHRLLPIFNFLYSFIIFASNFTLPFYFTYILHFFIFFPL